MSAPVDVLAVMDEWTAGVWNDRESWGAHLLRHAEARAAVAYAIDALEKIERRAKPHPDDDDADRERNLYHVEAYARAARIRIRGAA